MTGQLIINAKDAFTTWGVILEQDAMSALMAPAPLKPFPENKGRGEHGKQVFTANPRVDERTVQLPLIIKAANETAFRSQYAAFVTELQGGVITITTSFMPGIKYRMLYESCAQFSEFRFLLGKCLLRLNEPNPNNRAI